MENVNKVILYLKGSLMTARQQTRPAFKFQIILPPFFCLTLNKTCLTTRMVCKAIEGPDLTITPVQGFESSSCPASPLRQNSLRFFQPQSLPIPQTLFLSDVLAGPTYSSQNRRLPHHLPVLEGQGQNSVYFHCNYINLLKETMKLYSASHLILLMIIRI